MPKLRVAKIKGFTVSYSLIMCGNHCCDMLFIFARTVRIYEMKLCPHGECCNPMLEIENEKI